MEFLLFKSAQKITDRRAFNGGVTEVPGELLRGLKDIFQSEKRSKCQRVLEPHRLLTITEEPIKGWFD